MMCVCAHAVGSATASASVVNSHSSTVTANRTRSSLGNARPVGRVSLSGRHAARIVAALGDATRTYQRRPGHQPVDPLQRFQRVVVVVAVRADGGARRDNGLDAAELAQPV